MRPGVCPTPSSNTRSTGGMVMPGFSVGARDWNSFSSGCPEPSPTHVSSHLPGPCSFLYTALPSQDIILLMEVTFHLLSYIELYGGYM